jgi:hypothetical protein
MSNKTTAVEWLFDQLPDHLRLTKDGLDMLNRAKEIERNQQEHAFKESRLTHPMVGFKHDTFEEYHSKTYGKP